MAPPERNASDDELRALCNKVLMYSATIREEHQVARALLARISESAPKLAEIEKRLAWPRDVIRNAKGVDKGSIAYVCYEAAEMALRLLRARGRTPTREQVIEFFFEGGHGNRLTKGYRANSEHAADAILKLFTAPEEPTNAPQNH